MAEEILKNIHKIKNKNLKPYLQIFYNDYNFNLKVKDVKIIVNYNLINTIFNNFIDFLLNENRINKGFYSFILNLINLNQHKKFFKEQEIYYNNNKITDKDFKVKKSQIKKEINKLSKYSDVYSLYKYIEDFYFKDELYLEGFFLIFIYQLKDLFKNLLQLLIDFEEEKSDFDHLKEISIEYAKSKYTDFINDIINSENLQSLEVKIDD